jgi:hypothetical protein
MFVTEINPLRFIAFSWHDNEEAEKGGTWTRGFHHPPHPSSTPIYATGIPSFRQVLFVFGQ